MIPLTKPFFGKEEINAVKKTLDSGWVAGQGPASAEFEKSFSAYLGVKNCVAVNNCTAALHLSLLALGIGKGDEVIVSDYTFPATGHAVLYCGAKPVFADVQKDSYNIDPAEIERLITPKTKAILPVHAFGYPAEMDKIMYIAKKNGLKVVEDAACAAGAKYRGKFAGTFAELGCYSFHGRKNVTTGEGGMVSTDDKTLASKVRSLSCFGMTSAFARQFESEFQPPVFTALGFNYKLSDIASAIGIEQLKRIEGAIERKNALAKLYGEQLSGVDGVTPPAVSKSVRHVYQSYVCLLDENINRNRIISKLRAKGVQAQIGTYASHIQPVYADYGVRTLKGACPNSLFVFEHSIALPMFYDLNEEQVFKVVKSLKEVVS
ncbi:MAG: DegT/DnrJ/EryC1/StrS family aminotransferase [Candidatus Norongarragalinales archaeon]